MDITARIRSTAISFSLLRVGTREIRNKMAEDIGKGDDQIVKGEEFEKKSREEDR
uniref:Uncharacterized protein n=1 Tax=Nelumbo nucifera TaxID=4432 RepID=A0A822ZPN5_NELNU|nr:TPA_asm: hypothetical protein HUJ06_003539 [Nelumbo nucifera]